MASRSTKPDLEPTEREAGAVVRGVDLSKHPSRSLVAAIQRALWQYGVLLFRDNDLDEAQQIDFTRAFGDVNGHPLGRIGGRAPGAADPNVFYLTNEPGAISGEGGSLGWHTDLEYMPEEDRSSNGGSVNAD